MRIIISGKPGEGKAAIALAIANMLTEDFEFTNVELELVGEDDGHLVEAVEWNLREAMEAICDNNIVIERS